MRAPSTSSERSSANGVTIAVRTPRNGVIAAKLLRRTSGATRSAHGSARSSCAATWIRRSSRPERRDELDADRDAVRLAERQRDRGLAGDVEDGGERTLGQAPRGRRPSGRSPESSQVPSGCGGRAVVGVSRRSKPETIPAGDHARERRDGCRRPEVAAGASLAADLSERPGERLDVVLGRSRARAPSRSVSRS